MAFEIAALVLIVPFAVAFLIGFVCICKHKMWMWGLKSGKSDSESEVGGGKKSATGSKGNKTAASGYDSEAGPSDSDLGEVDAILKVQEGSAPAPNRVGGGKMLCL